MKTLTNLISLLIFLPIFSTAQVSIKGHLTDSSGVKNAEFATVALKRIADSVIVTSAVTDFNGMFELKNIKPGNYILSFSHMSYNEKTTTIKVTKRDGVITLGKVKLMPKEVALDEVVISGKSTPITIKKDTIEFNTIAYKPRENDVVEDVLKKLPGVAVGSDGAITINGKQVKEVMVDGKKFFLNDPKMATQNLPADIIDRIQIIDKKSEQAEFSKIDDGETDKVINLTLKQDKKKGYFGNIRGGVGTTSKYDASMRLGAFKGGTQLFTTGNFNNINRGGRGGGRSSYPNPGQNGIVKTGSGALNLNSQLNEKVVANGSYRFSYGNTTKNTSTIRENFDDKGNYKSNNASESDVFSRSHNVFTRFEYTIDSLNSLVFSPSVQYSNGDNRSQRNSFEYDSMGGLVNSENINSSSESDNKNYGFDLLYRKAFKKSRQTFSIQLSGRQTENSGNEYTKQENYYAINDSTNFRNQNVLTGSSNDNVNTRMVFTYPLAKQLTFEANYQMRYTNNTSNNNAYDFNPSTNEYDIVNLIYSADYRNRIFANTFGGRINLVAGKIITNIGVSGLLTNQDYHNQRGGNELDTTMKYSSISPSFIFSYRPSDSHAFDFNYTGRSKEPLVDQIQPIQNPNTPNLILLSNQNLLEEFTHNFSFSFDYFNRTSFWSASNYLMLNLTKNSIVSQTYRDELGKNYRRAVNVNGFYNIGNFTSIGKSLFNNRFHLSSTTSLNYSHTPGFVNEIKYFTNQLIAGEIIRSSLSLEYLELGINGGLDYSWIDYQGLDGDSRNGKNNTSYATLSVDGNVTTYLPWNIEINSTVSFSRKYGEMASNGDNSILWNASISRKFLKRKELDVSFIAFDILNRYKPFNRNVSSNFIEETTFTTISQMFMVSVSYNLNRFGASKSGKRGHEREQRFGTSPSNQANSPIRRF